MARPARLDLIEMFKMDMGKHHFSFDLPEEDPAGAACRFKWFGDRGKAARTLPGSVSPTMNAECENLSFESK